MFTIFVPQSVGGHNGDIGGKKTLRKEIQTKQANHNILVVVATN